MLDEVTRAAVDLLHVRSAAVVAGSGDYLAVRSLALAGTAPPSVLAAAEADLLERCGPRMLVSGEHFVGADNITITPGDDETMLFAPLEGEAAPPPSVLVVADRQQGEFDAEDRLLLSTLAAQLNASMHNAIAYQREHVIAETFQQALLMEAPPIPGIEVGVHYRAATDSARVGGDFYDLVSLGPGKLMVIVGDVCGKSLTAAAQSAVVRYMLRAYAAESSPGEALSRLNSAVITQTPNQPFVTLVVAYIDVARHMFEYACAGHPRPLVLAGRGEFPMPGEGNVPVGIFRGATYPTNRAVLPDASCIVLYTDGITEARRDGVLFGEERLLEAVPRQPAIGRPGARGHHSGGVQGVRRRHPRRRLRRGHHQAAVGRGQSWGAVRPGRARRSRAALTNRRMASASMNPSRRPPESTTTALSASRSRSSLRTSTAWVSGVTDGRSSAGVMTSRTRSRS